MAAAEQTRVTLFEAVTQYRALIEALEAEDLQEQHDPETGEVAESPVRDLLGELLEAMEGTVADKMEKCAAVVRFHRQQEHLADEERERLDHRATVLRNRAKRMEARMLAAMQYAGLVKVEWPLGGCSIRKPSLHVEVVDPGALPTEYRNRGELADLLDEAIQLLHRVGGVEWVADDIRAFLEVAVPELADHLAKAPVRKAEIAKALKAKEVVPGAALVPGAASLVIR